MHCGGNRQQESHLYFTVNLYIFENVWSLRILLREKVHQRGNAFKLFPPEPLGEWRRRSTVTRMFLPSRRPSPRSPFTYTGSKKNCPPFFYWDGKGVSPSPAMQGRQGAKQANTHTHIISPNVRSRKTHPHLPPQYGGETFRVAAFRVSRQIADF